MLLSIIIPIYKVEKYIVDCIESIVVQLKPEHSVEMICVNDGTPDESMDILKKYLSGLDINIQNKFKLIDQDNKGLSGARNKGLNIAQGEYISFLDSDDKLYSSYLDVILGTINKNDFDILDFNIKKSNGLEIKIRVDVSSLNQLDSIFKAGNWFACARVYNKRVFVNQKFTVGIYYEDVDLIPILYLKAEKTIHLGDILYWYRYNPEGITQKKSKSVNLKSINSLEEILKSYIFRNSLNNCKYMQFMVFHSYYLLCVYTVNRHGYLKSIKLSNKYKDIIESLDLSIISQYFDLFEKIYSKCPKLFIFIYAIYCRLKELKKVLR